MGGRMSPEYHRAYYLAHREQQLAKEKAARAARTPEQIEAEKAYQRAYRQRNRERLLEYDRARSGRWGALPPETLDRYRRNRAASAEADPERYKLKNRMGSSKRRAQELKATPPWADAAAIKKVFAKARELEVEDGQKRHVDHIVPLKGKTVCGLHVACNLQILTAEENLKKKHWYDDWS